MFKKPLAHFIFYIVGIILLVTSNKLSPTNLAGPGLDIIVLIILFVSIISLLTLTWFKFQIEVSNKLIISSIHLIGISLIVWFICKPK